MSPLSYSPGLPCCLSQTMKMREDELTGYENEPEEIYLPLPADLYCSFFQLVTPTSEDEQSFYLANLEQHRCHFVLELGCGTGRVTEYLKSAGFTVIGIDNCHQMLIHAQESRQAVSFEMDMCRLGFRQLFDSVIVPCNTLNLLSEEKRIRQCLCEIKQVLQPKGLLILHLFVPDADLRRQPGQNFFQFSLNDLPEGGKLIKETMRCYDSERQLLRLVDRFKIRTFQGNDQRRNYIKTYRLAAWDPIKWQDTLQSSGFSIISTSPSFCVAPTGQQQSTTLLVLAISV